MKNQINSLYEQFVKIKERGWIKSVRNGSNGVGLTFESLLGISQNEFEIPDYNGIELKAKRYKSRSYILLFSCTPTGPRYHEVERIKNEYGYPHKLLKEYKILNNSVYCNVKNKIGIKFYFQLEVNREQRKLYLIVYNLRGDLIEKSVYWDFDILKEKLYRKLKVLALIKAYSKKIEDIEYFKYYKLTIYLLKNFDTFIDLIETGIIRVNFKLNIRTSGNKIGQIHDHGTSFDIMESDILKLYDKYVLS